MLTAKLCAIKLFVFKTKTKKDKKKIKKKIEKIEKKLSRLLILEHPNLKMQNLTLNSVLSFKKHLTNLPGNLA